MFSPDTLIDALFDQLDDFVLLVGEDLRVVARGVAWSASFGEAELVATLFPSSRARLLEAVAEDEARQVELVHVDRRGQPTRVAWRLVRTEAQLLLVGRDLGDDDRRLDEILRLQREFQRTSDELRRLANTDPLTGTANRRAGLAAAREVWNGGGAASAVLVDLDRFKRINDQHGHEAGDAVLEAVGAALQRAVGTRGVVARWGGEEFACFLRGDGTPSARAMSDAIRCTRVEDGTTTLGVTGSIGVAVVGDTAHVPLSDAIAAADAAMYEAKAAGRDGVMVRQLLPRTRLRAETGLERRVQRRWRVA